MEFSAFGSPVGRGSSTWFQPSPIKTPPPKTPDPCRQLSDRFIPDRGSQDHSMSRFYLTSKENQEAPATTLLRSPERSVTVASPSNASSAALSCTEPYTQMLARTLFPAPQTSVLGLHQPNVPSESEAVRYAKSMAVVYEENKSHHFLSRNFRVIAQTPERILDAPELLDDFYLNLIDWSSNNVLTVALGNTVYLWNADSGTITQLMNTSDRENPITSVSWHADGELLAVGTEDSCVHIWNTVTKKHVHTLKSHTQRVVSLSWNGSVLASGSRDATVALSDTREARSFASLSGHTQEICGLRWSPNGQQLASGANDNQLNIWDFRRHTMECLPLFSLKEHTAAIKALAWNPVQSNLLVSGGGSADKTLRFWNTSTGQCIQHVDAKSQICGVLWNRDGTELVSSHGFSDNQLTLWKYPSLKKITDLMGHTSRVLHLAMSPDGQVVVSAAGDETIRFWRCFSPAGESDEDSTMLATSSSFGMPPSHLVSPMKRMSRRDSGTLKSPSKGPNVRQYSALDHEELR